MWAKGHWRPKIHVKHDDKRRCTVAVALGSHKKTLNNSAVASLLLYSLRSPVTSLGTVFNCSWIQTANQPTACQQLNVFRHRRCGEEDLLKFTLIRMEKKGDWNGFECGMAITAISRVYREWSQKGKEKKIQWAAAMWKEMPRWSQGLEVRMGSLVGDDGKTTVSERTTG